MCGERQAGKSRTTCWKCNSKQFAASRNRAKARRRQELRLRLIEAYGGRCVACGEADPDVLVLDHINDDGAEHRRQVGNPHVYKELERDGYPPVVQVLCANDNMRKERARYGLERSGS